MSTETSGSPLGVLGLLVAGGGIGYAAFITTRPGTVGGFVRAVQSDLHLVAVILLVAVFGVTLSAYSF